VRVRKLEEAFGNVDETIVREVIVDGQRSTEIEVRMHGQLLPTKRIIGVPPDAF
jgi:hypothetical protein